MNIKTQKKDFSDVDYRFNFSLTINDSNGNDVIICKRDFNIYNFDEESLYSLELKECIDDVMSLIENDLKSKTRTYLWCNTPLDIIEINGERRVGVYHGSNKESNDVIDELKTPINNDYNTIIKFTFFDRDKPIISKILSADSYPFYIRNSVDLTNRKFKSENGRNFEIDFLKQISQRSSIGKHDLTSIIIKTISSTCGSSKSKNGKKVIYKQTPQEINIDNVCFNGICFSHVQKKLQKVKQITDDNGKQSDIYEVYTTKIPFGEKIYNLDTRSAQTKNLIF